jgi:hypothetical protein
MCPAEREFPDGDEQPEEEGQRGDLPVGAEQGCRAGGQQQRDTDEPDDRHNARHEPGRVQDRCQEQCALRAGTTPGRGGTSRRAPRPVTVPQVILEGANYSHARAES